MIISFNYLPDLNYKLFLFRGYLSKEVISWRVLAVLVDVT